MKKLYACRNCGCLSTRGEQFRGDGIAEYRCLECCSSKVNIEDFQEPECA